MEKEKAKEIEKQIENLKKQLERIQAKTAAIKKEEKVILFLF
jgi:hypothetical protein